MAYEFNPYQCPLGLGLYFYVEVLKAKKTFEDEYQCPLGLGLYFYPRKVIKDLDKYTVCINALSGWGSISTLMAKVQCLHSTVAMYQCPLGLGLYFYGTPSKT